MIRLISNQSGGDNSSVTNSPAGKSAAPVNSLPGKSFDQEANNLNIHTIPERFYRGQLPGSSGKAKKIVAILVIIVVLLGISTIVVLLTMKPIITVPTAPVINNRESNKNINANLNANSNTNFNANYNTNSNANNNTNGNLNVNVNSSSVNENVNGGLITPADDFTALPAGTDSDKDSLTDVEEGIFTTEIKKPDTDGDSYLDGEEVLNLYSPTGKGEKLIKGSAVKEYQNSKYSYSVLYPAIWEIKTMDSASSEVFFVSVGSEFVSLTVADNSDKLSLSDWYKNNIKSPAQSADLADIKVDGLSGIKDSRNMVVYLVKDQQVYIFAYNLAGAKIVNYETAFMMMVNSFKINSAAVKEPPKI